MEVSKRMSLWRCHKVFQHRVLPGGSWGRLWRWGGGGGGGGGVGGGGGGGGVGWRNWRRAAAAHHNDWRGSAHTLVVQMGPHELGCWSMQKCSIVPLQNFNTWTPNIQKRDLPKDKKHHQTSATSVQSSHPGCPQLRPLPLTAKPKASWAPRWKEPARFFNDLRFTFIEEQHSIALFKANLESLPMGSANYRRDEPFCKQCWARNMEIRAVKRGENAQNLFY